MMYRTNERVFDISYDYACLDVNIAPFFLHNKQSLEKSKITNTMYTEFQGSINTESQLGGCNTLPKISGL